MKNYLRLLAMVVIVVATRPAQAVVGYYNYIFGPGSTLFTSQLDNSPNDLNTLFIGGGSGYTPTAGTTISLWNPVTLSYTLGSTYSGSAWSVDLTLQAGMGYRLNTLTTFTNTFVGNVLNHDGTPYSGTLTPPPVYVGPNGIYLLADKTPLVDTGTDIFLNILGRLPNVGEQVITLAGTDTYLGGGLWSSGTPTLNVGDAALLNIGPVPEPTTVALGLLGFALVSVFRRRRQ